ncbi:MAG: glycine betaine ABC transporter substrate-binding protein [Pseudomonadota bacterium]|nr:glycine betaine ABC transporter substrate-binding protein [Pseudomonadota bacterium]
MPATKPIRLGHIDLSFHKASALKVAEVLKCHGHEVEHSFAHHEDAFDMLAKGKIDMLSSAWLPSSHQKYLDPIEGDVEKVTVLYEPYCLWGVPDFVPESDLAEIGDLTKEPSLSKVESLIQGINPGAGISRFSAQMIEEYGLGEHGYHFETGTEADCFDRFEEAVAQKRWVIVPLWQPQYLHNRYQIRELRDPKGLLGSKDEATLLLRKDARSKLSEGALRDLRALHIGNSQMNALDDELRQSDA